VRIVRTLTARGILGDHKGKRGRTLIHHLEGVGETQCSSAISRVESLGKEILTVLLDSVISLEGGRRSSSNYVGGYGGDCKRGQEERGGILS
jgi:hypothetical protein